ncbi:MAG: insulinase family protein [Gammaproteobacteria bacterium]|nr:insulinase family protein [Gammaproteobacteria bacterium]MDH3362613.1 insulinase family protein [Gammaproteobacteria bacterium]
MQKSPSLPATLVSFVLLVFAPVATAADIEIPYTEYTLDNGLRLIVHEDNKAPIVAVNIWYHVGSKNEKPGKTGFAHLFEHLMFQGTENYDDEYFKPFERVGATDMNGTTNFDRTNYFQNVPKTALDMALWMESDRMGHLLGAVTQEKLDEQRGVVQNEKRQGDNQPYGKVFYHLLEGAFPEGHPYSWSVIGSMEDLNAASLEDVQEWFKTYYGPSNAVLVVAGDVVANEVFEKVKLYFGDIPPGPPISRYDVWEAQLESDKFEVLQDRVPQARYYKIWGGPHLTSEDTDLLDLAGDVLAGGKNSRLYERLVYNEQIATSAQAGMFANEIAGIFWVVVTAQPGGDMETLKRAVDEEVDRLMQEGISKDELERVKAARRGGFVRGIERIGGFGGKSDVLARNAVYAGRPDFYKVQLQRFENASIDSIEAAIDRWLKAGAYHLEVRPFPVLSAASESADRSGIPDTTSFPEVAFSDFERDTLSNGLELIVATRRSIPTINMSLRFDAGFASDQFGEPGTSSLAMAMLDEGTKRRTALQISDELDRISAMIGAGSNLDSSTVTLDTLSENLDKALDIYADVILNPVFPETDLERLRKQRIAQIQQEKNQPVQMALRTFPKLLFGDGHAYAQPLTGSGTEASVARITRDSLVDYHRTWFKPNNGTLIVVGDTTLAEIKPRLEKQFAKWKPGDIPTKNIGIVEVSNEERVFMIDRPNSEQSIIFAGNIAPPAGKVNEIALETMNEIIGGSFTSRINMNLREDKSWAYGALTFIPDAAGQRPFIAYAPVQTDKTMESMAEIKRELGEYLSSNPATDAEMAKVKDNNTLSLPGRWETNAAVLRDIGEIVSYGLPDDYWDTYAESVRGLSLEQINEVAGQAIRPDNLTWVVVGDREKIESRIRQLELGEITQIDADGNIITTTSAH